MKTYFTCVVYSGNTCMCRTLQHTSRECGHKHKTEEAAKKCLTKQQCWSEDRRSCSANWYCGTVVERETKHDSEVFWDLTNRDAVILDGASEDYELTCAYDACRC